MCRGRHVVVVVVKFSVDDGDSLVDGIGVLRTRMPDINEVSINSIYNVQSSTKDKITPKKRNILAGPLYMTRPPARSIRRSKRENTSQLG